MCTVLGVARSTYYKSFDKTKSAREVENEELKLAIKSIYKDNKGVYGAPRIHHILKREGLNVSLKGVQRKMTELNLCAITVKNNCSAFGKRMTNDLVSKSLEKAYYSQNPDKNKKLIFHSDLGSQYTSSDLKELCKEFNITQSFSKKGYTLLLIT